MAIEYVSSDRAKYTYEDRAGKKKTVELLWGDRVVVQRLHGAEATVKARGFPPGEVSRDDLGGEPLLEVYFIDVGQGDGVLICTPDRKHVLIDAGYIRSRQPTGKNAADFVDWKFFKDYGKRRIKLEAMIASHCDADHYGGLWDLLSDAPEAKAELDCQGVDVDVLYHAGVSWWKTPSGGRWLGPVRTVGDDQFLVQLLDDRAHVGRALSGNGPQLQGEWAKFMQAAHVKGMPIRRLTHVDGFVPEFGPGENDATLMILAPVEYDVSNGSAFRAYGRTASQNTNGHSLLLRLDYGRARILLTGDLNKKSMQAILEDIESRQDLQCDVAKGCHHGSDDISYEFLQAMAASATVISSGDNEGHAHPRPTVVAASALTGHVIIKRDELRTPLIYSTEISRSLDIGRLTTIHDSSYRHGNEDIEVTLGPQDRARLDYEVVRAGDLRPAKKSRSFHSGTRVVDRVLYGLVNVRTNGRRILCATMNEKKDKWEVTAFDSRF